ncbi:MAG: imidazolonepropionase [Polyangiaceae bacterium]
MSEGPRAVTAARIVTCDPSRMGSLGIIEHGAIVVGAGKISWIGPRTELDPRLAIDDAGDAVITPGLVDAHTHAAWAGSRHGEYAVRMAGGDYEAIAAAGGGIVSTQHAVAGVSEDALTEQLGARLARMAALGVTTCEVKSGYGLEAEYELKQLRAIARVSLRPDLPRVVATFLALHAIPPSARADRDGYVRGVVETLLPTVAHDKLATFVDAYVDANAFRIDEARILGKKAQSLGLGLRLHVGQFADVGGAELAAELGARSADHLEHVSDEGIGRLAASGTHAVLLPVASFTLGQAPPPVAALRAAGVPLVVASDANPGTAPSESLPLAMALAVATYGLTPAEAILGVTRGAALSLGLTSNAAGARPRGSLTPGARPDIVVWDLPHEHAILQPWGAAKTHLVLRNGRPIGGSATRS